MKTAFTFLLICSSFYALAQSWSGDGTNLFFTTGKVGIGNTNPATKLDIAGGGISISGANPVSSVWGFYNAIQFKNMPHAALVYEPGTADELMFGFHSGGKFYWGTGQSATNPNYYSMSLDGNNGNLGIKGKLTASEVNVKVGGWSDFVFDHHYNLPSLKEVENFIQKEGHLPDIPSAGEVLDKGVNLGEMDALLLQKIEELTLYVIELKKENQEMKTRLEKLETIKNQ